MSEQEARKIFSHAVAMHKVFGGNIRTMCADRGVPEELIGKFLAEQDFWDRGLSRFDWDGSVRKKAESAGSRGLSSAFPYAINFSLA